MGNTLFAWLGMADIRSSQEDDASNLGPIGQAVCGERYERVSLLTDHAQATTQHYVKWLKKHCEAVIETEAVKLSSPTAFGEIYEAATKLLLRHQAPSADFTFHLSPGTPAMAAVWIILAKTRFPATLIESSRDHGVRKASVPFDISAEYIPHLLRKPDEELKRLAAAPTPEAPEFADILHRSECMTKLIAKAQRAAPRDIPILIMGESGTGKELLAKAIHRASTRAAGSFVPVNCGAIPYELVESELFGHEKGAFTGASTAKIGYIEAAHGGTLFLDEVGELPKSAQVKMLRVLQEQQVTRVGATKARAVDFRVIAATNRNLLQEVAEGSFREDLFHRIAVAVLNIPPLRERQGDVGLLVDRLLAHINDAAQNQPGFQRKKLSPSARNLLLHHPWPGNVRELVNTLQRAAVWSVGPVITLEDAKEALLTIPRDGTMNILNRTLGDGLKLPDLLDEVARHYLQRAMQEAGGNKTRAATLVGLPNYQTLTNWLKRLGLDTS